MGGHGGGIHTKFSFSGTVKIWDQVSPLNKLIWAATDNQTYQISQIWGAPVRHMASTSQNAGVKKRSYKFFGPTKKLFNCFCQSLMRLNQRAD